MIGLLLGLGLVAVSGYEIYRRNDNGTNEICDHNELNILKGTGIECSKNVRLSVKQSNEHILMVAPSGAGKSRRFIMHNVNSLQNCSIICTDPSGEIEKETVTNKKIYILNPFKENTVGYDPLINCKNEFEVRKMAGVILTNGSKQCSGNGGESSRQKEWLEMARPLLTSYMLMNYHTKKHNFSEMMINICTKPILPLKNGKELSIYEEIIDSDVNSSIIEILSFLQVMGATQTLSSIRTVMNSCLQLFMDTSIKRIFDRNKPSLDLSKLRHEESILFIQVPEHHADYFSPLVATLVSQMFDNYLENDGLQIYCLLDEMANNGLIPSFGKLLSTARKHNISIVGAVQNLIQLSTLYGELQGKELKELFKTIMVCGGLRDSAEYISSILGVAEIYNNNIKQSKSLMTADEIRRMNKDEILIICDNKRPVIDKMLPIIGAIKRRKVD